MKKIIIVLLAALSFGVAASAQSKAIGARLGYGGEISYQHYMGGENFLEADLGFLGGNGFYLTGVYDFNIGSAGNFNFYAGPGAQVGAWAGKDANGNAAGGLGLAIVGQLGAEFQIPAAPVNISLDWRPAFNFIHGGFGWQGIALGIRYRF